MYDHETGLYYLQSRYYDPQTHRFLNADVLVSTGQGMLGNNMFAYCRNNPVCRKDTRGIADATIYGDGELLSSDDLESRQGGGHQALVNAIGATLALTAATLAKNDDDRIYTVYYLYATEGDPTKIVYVGRVKTINFKARMAYHATQGRSLSYYTSNLNYEECRAMEQAGMMWHHTINRGDPINNQIRGISPTNGNRHNYFEAIMLMIAQGIYPDSALLPLSYWENLTENEWLNIIN